MSRRSTGRGPGAVRAFPASVPAGLSVAAVVLAAAVLVVVMRGPAPSVATDAPPGPPYRRVVSLVPSVNELVVALGAGDRLVGRTRYDALPALAGLPSVGGPADPDLETILSLQPDLVVTWAGITGPAAEEALLRAGVAVHPARVERVDDVFALTRVLGAFLEREAAADALAEEMAAALAGLARRVAERPRPSVVLLLHPDPPLSAGPGSYLHELLELAGGRNAFPDAGPWPTLSLEAVLRRDPDAVVVSAREGERAAARLREAAGWRRLGAVQEGRILELPASSLARPGPRMVDVARALAAFLHGSPGTTRGVRP